MIGKCVFYFIADLRLKNAVESIFATSVESERVFSITGNIVTKTRNQLDDDTIDILVFLKNYLLKEVKRDWNICCNYCSGDANSVSLKTKKISMWH